MRETIRTRDAELYIGWPTTPDDIERDASVQVGVRYGVDARWAVLTSPDQVADLRRQLQRASRAVWPQTPPPNPGVTSRGEKARGGLLPPAPLHAEGEGAELFIPALPPALLEPDPGIVADTARNP